MPPLFNQAGRPVLLGTQVGDRGAEGAAYIVADDASSVAKVYHKPPDAQKVEKLRWMIGLDRKRAEQVVKVAAWPRSLLFDRPGGSVAGFQMPRLVGFQSVQHLYNTAQRRRYFPRADWAFLAHVARNVAAAFDEIHQLGCLIGDVSMNNVLVSENGKIGLIDCDSYQVTTSAGVTYKCDVGTPLYIPPEFLPKAPKGAARTQNHDRFGLAVLIFQLLFVGRHPYAGVYRGSGDPSSDKLIEEFRFAYGRQASRLQMGPPPHAPDLDIVPPEVGLLFERAFLLGSEIPGTRPPAGAWVTAADSLRKRIPVCATNAGHKMSGHLTRCPWCVISTAGGPDYFAGVAAVAILFQFDSAKFGTLFAKYGQLANVLFVPYDRRDYRPADGVQAEPPPENPKEHQLLSRILGGVTAFGAVMLLVGLRVKYAALFGFVVAVVFGAWFAVHTLNSPKSRERHRRKRALHSAEFELNKIERRWIRESEGYSADTEERRARIEKLRDRCQRLDADYAVERRRLEQNREALARDEHLRSQFIIDAEIPGIGTGRKQVLASYNIETAFDISEGAVRAVKGFGPALTNNLLAWRQQVFGTFRFDPKSSVPESDLRVLTARYIQIQGALFADLDVQIRSLQGLADTLTRRKREVAEEMTSAVAAWAQARADVRACQ